MIRENLTSEKISKRIITLSVLFIVIFFGVTTLSYFLLPEGFLLNKNRTADFQTSTNVFLCTIQIFAWNMISISAIFIGSIFSKRNNEKQNYLSMSYYVFFLAISIAAITLGTWSFTVTTESIPLFDRIISMFNITERAGLIELFGTVLITCSLSDKALLMTTKNKTITRKIKDIKWNRNEIICAFIGFMLMLIAAYVESKAIIG